MTVKISIPTGSVFGHLTVIREDDVRRNNSKVRWLCRCDCGNVISVDGTSLRNGHTTSCRCRRGAALLKRNTRHALTGRPEYRAWRHIIGRCLNPSDAAFDRYGGRGIRVCDRWRDFANFHADMGERPSPKHSIDRIDNDGPYCPENCRWATITEQNRNTRANVLITHDGVTATATEWSHTTGLAAAAIIRRIRRGWPVARALTEPSRRQQS